MGVAAADVDPVGEVHVVEAADRLVHLGTPALGADLLAPGLSQGDVEGHALAERAVRQVEVGEQRAVVEERGAHAGPQRHDELDAVSFDDRRTLHIGVVDDDGRQVEGVSEGVGKGEAAPIRDERGVGRPAVLAS